MATIKVKFRSSSVADHYGIIYYQITHERKVRQFLSGYHILPSEWDNSRSRVVINTKCARASTLIYIRERIRLDIECFAKIIHKLNMAVGEYTADDVIDEFKRYSYDFSLYHYMESLILKLKNNGKIRTSETYKSTLNSFKKFRNGEDVMLDCITSDVMEAYEAWLRCRGVSLNTISFYTRILRAVYNRAVEQDAIEHRNPFKHVYTGIDKTVKRALSLTTIKKIKALDLTLFPKLEYARDMFMLSFYLRGMSFIDMAYLRKSDLRNGYIIYRRRKTGQQLSIKWTDEMQIIVDKYPENKSDYLLPIIKSPNTNDRTTYLNVGYNINHHLKKVAQIVNANIPLTMYVARHSWASAAKFMGIPLSVISEGLGHDSETTTRIYLASLDTAVIDHANDVILKSLC